ncbi:MAG: hypothetical protein ACRDH7_08645 [Actinomycetota bacterium]
MTGLTEPTPGWALLDDLGSTLTRDQVSATLRAFAASAGAETSLTVLRDTTAPAIDLSVRAHREALLRFLRAWGCRHLRRDDTGRSSRALASWWSRYAPTLPPATAPLTDLSGAQLAALGQAYDALARSPAAFRSSRDGDVKVSFGDTAAAKALFAIRPQAVPPWDEPMRRAFGWGRVDAEQYATFLAAVRDALIGLAERLPVEPSELPEELGRPESSPAKIVDEFLWIRITRGLPA